MAIFYRGEIIANKTVKQKLRKENTATIKKDKIKQTLFYKKIWFIGPIPEFHLLEGKVIADLGDKYKVVVKSRSKRSNGEYKVMDILKRKIHFDK